MSPARLHGDVQVATALGIHETFRIVTHIHHGIAGHVGATALVHGTGAHAPWYSHGLLLHPSRQLRFAYHGTCAIVQEEGLFRCILAFLLDGHFHGLVLGVCGIPLEFAYSVLLLEVVVPQCLARCAIEHLKVCQDNSQHIIQIRGACGPAWVEGQFGLPNLGEFGLRYEQVREQEQEKERSAHVVWFMRPKIPRTAAEHNTTFMRPRRKANTSAGRACSVHPCANSRAASRKGCARGYAPCRCSSANVPRSPCSDSRWPIGPVLDAHAR